MKPFYYLGDKMNKQKNYENFISFINNDDLDTAKIDASILLNDEIYNSCVKRAEKLTIETLMLVKDQEDKIKKSINSALMVSDKLIICDTGSTDSTVKQIISLNDNRIELIFKDWVEDFGLMRNHLINLSTGDWLFMLDSDEYFVTSYNITDLKFLLASLEHFTHKRDIILRIIQKAEDIEGAAYPQRIFKNSSELSFFGIVHEELRSNIDVIDLRTNYKVFNSGANESEIEKFDKVNRYTRLLLENIKQEPNNIKWYALLNTKYILNNIVEFEEKIIYFINILISKSQVVGTKNKTIQEYYFLKIYIIYLIMQISQKKNIKSIQEDIKIGIELLGENPIFYYFKYIILIDEINSIYESKIQDLKHDISKLRDNFDEKWEIYYPFIYLEEIAVKLLIKSEHYELARDLFENITKDSKKIEVLHKESILFNGYEKK